MNKSIYALAVALFLLAGCASEPLPFEARYTSPDSVIVTYQGQKYVLNRYADKVQAPFDYEFEDDGDLDLRIGGKVYDIDSPYDIDIDKKKVVKKVSSSTKKVSSKKTVKKSSHKKTSSSTSKKR